MIFEQQPQRGYLPELVGGNRRNLESPLAFRDDEAFGRYPVQKFAQRADAGPVDLADFFELEFLAGQENAKNDVGSDPAVRRFSDRLS